MDYMVIFMSVILSLIVATGLTWVLFVKLHKREMEKIKEFKDIQNQLSDARELLHKAEVEKSALKIEMERKISEATSRGYQDNSSKEIEIAELKKQIATKDAEYIRQLQEQKTIAYNAGSQEALKDYKIICTPFFRYKDGFFSSESWGGYSYRLLVKGIPVFEPAEIIVDYREKFDENVKKMIINTVNTTVNSIGKQIGGIPFERLSINEEAV